MLIIDTAPVLDDEYERLMARYHSTTCVGAIMDKAQAYRDLNTILKYLSQDVASPLRQAQLYRMLLEELRSPNDFMSQELYAEHYVHVLSGALTASAICGKEKAVLYLRLALYIHNWPNVFNPGQKHDEAFMRQWIHDLRREARQCVSWFTWIRMSKLIM